MSETDPHGKAANTPGAKMDAGKNRLGLVLGGFALALQEVGKVGTYGAVKYTDAMYRHQFREASGELNDADTGLAHAAHAAWNALARLELALKETVK
jgi:hypothetical protein